jgi:hypothetical protein
MGLSVNNTHAIIHTMMRRSTPFVRTAKYNAPETRSRRWWRTSYAQVGLTGVVWLELLLLLYSVAGLVAIVYWGEWAAIPFQALFVLGFGLVVAFTFEQYYRAVAAVPGED